MPAVVVTFLIILYLTATLSLIVFGFHRFYLLYLYSTCRHHSPRPLRLFQTLPRVTIQVPIFNELYVVERLISAVTSFDYPRNLLEIQVLDDSTDETQDVAKRLVARLRREGVNIAYIHREDRRGFKAGALAEGLRQATGEFIAIFDADFLPPPEFLKRTIHYFTDPIVGMVQVRWGHLNADYSLLTRVQSMFLDGHFAIEHTVRSRSGRFFNFNGTAGIWRRCCIEEAGGWQHDTLTEDLDLSYRAQMAGWRFVFLVDVIAPAELPVEMNAYKTQQHRWAKGSVQTAKKLLRPIWQSHLPLGVKLEATFHLTSNFSYLLMIVPSLLMFPAIAFHLEIVWYWAFLLYGFLFLGATISVILFFLCSQWELYRKGWWRRILYLPWLMAIGIGLSVNNARAVIEALVGHQTGFERTPKYAIRHRTDGWWGKRYIGQRSIYTLLELLLSLYFSGTILYAISRGYYHALPFSLLFQVGFLYVGALSLYHHLQKSTRYRNFSLFVV
jgi:cellulose synthase/poly-beta-1,6-N-acetylglucosamine synthase-like glycosyltransferase